MAITSKFYTGSVDHVDWSKGAPEVGSSFYGAEGFDDWRPTAVSGADRTVRIGTGTIWGRGVRDFKDTTTDVSIPSVASGTRWDLIVARRTWGTSTTSVVRVQGTSTKGIPAGRTVGPGVVDDQPLALVKVTAGSTAITELVDLRVFGGGAGGLQALDKLALQYLNFPGALVYLGTEVWVYPAEGNDWVKVTNFEGIQLFGAGSALFGSAGTRVADKSPFLMQAGTATGTTDPSGYSRLSWPKQFPNGLLVAILFNGDAHASANADILPTGNAPFWGTPAGGNKTEIVYKLLHPTTGALMPNQLHRVNYFVIGF